MEFLFQIPVLLGKALWEPIGILFLGGVIWLIWSHRKTWREPFFVVVSAGLIFAFSWRFFLKISVARYYLTFLLPALFIIFYVVRKGPWPKKYAYLLLFSLYAACIGKDLRYNEIDRASRLLYQLIKEDAAHYHHPLLLLSGGSISKAEYYAKLPSLKIGHPVLNREMYFDSLKRNLNFYDGIVDCIYFCTEFRHNEKNIYQRWKTDSLFTEISEKPHSSTYKKHKAVFKYIPAGVSTDYEISPHNILTNGDLSELMSVQELAALKNSWKTRLPYISSEKFAFPRGWTIYHSQTRKSDAVALCLKEGNKNIFDLSAEKNFISVITPFFPANKAFILSFTIRAIRNSQMDLIIHLQNPQGNASEFYPYFPIFMPAGTQKTTTLVFPAFPRRANERIHFWLNSGHIRISDVSVHTLTMKAPYQYE